MAKPQAVLSLLADNWAGNHPGAWRAQDAPSDPSMDLEQVRRVLETAERGKFHTFFLADTYAAFPTTDPDILSLTANATRFEPFTLCSALAMCTSRIGLAMTASTTYNEPFNVARMFNSLDILSSGRAGWNVVTSGPEAAPKFGREPLEHSLRYSRATEFVEVVKALWDSWEDDAFIRDKQAGIHFRPQALHALDHHGEHFAVEGPLMIPRPVQGHPVIAQAGASPQGLAFATAVADIIFTLQLEIDSARALYAEIKERAAEHGRNPEHVKVLPGLSLLLGRTTTEAEDRAALFDDLADPRIGIDALSSLIDFDLSAYPLDGPVPFGDIPETERGSKSLQRDLLDQARDGGLTIRQFAHLAIRNSVAPMTPLEVADYIEEQITTGAADGFNIYFADAIRSLDIFVEQVVPELQRRGIFHEDYEGSTLRENLGLPRPSNQFAVRSTQAQR